MRKMVNNFKIKILIAFLSILFTCFGLEIILRIFGTSGYYQIKYGWHNYNMRPINSLGFRDVEHSFKKPKGVFRILFIGDSFTEAWGVKFEKSYTQVLASMLNKMENGRKFESIVCAEWGANTLRELDLFLNKCKNYDADLIIIGFVLNDVDPTIFFKEKKQFLHSLRIRKPKGISAFLYENSNLFRLIYLKLETTRIKRTLLESYDEFYINNSKEFLTILDAIKTFQKESKNLKSKLLVAIFPFLEYELGKNYPFKKFHNLIYNELNKLGIETVDTLPYFLGKDNLSLQVNPGYDAHPNEFGHQIIAEAIYKYLISHPYIYLSKR